jgi:PAS domain S-box-containing protein
MIMSEINWQRLTLIERIRWLRFILPPVLAIVVIIYQLGVAQQLARDYGQIVHYGVEIGFYSLIGPVATWLTLVWVERSLREKEQLEQKVRLRTQQLASLTAVSADAILTLDTTGRILSWNQGATTMLGYPAGEITGRPLSQLLPHAETLITLFQEKGVVQNYETMAKSRSGQLLAVNLTQTGMKGDSDPSASLMIMRDVTARHEREAILEEERARIARDLHDGVAQTLYFAALKADALRQGEPEAAQMDNGLRDIGHNIRQVIRDVRRTILALHPLDWTEESFIPALRRFVTAFAEQMGWQLHTNIAADLPEIPARLEPTLFRLVQESFNNVAKHAQATQVWLSLYPGDKSTLQLTVRDNGVGFTLENVSNGLGLRQMEARVKRLGGAFEITSKPGEGTVTRTTIPIYGGENG